MPDALPLTDEQLEQQRIERLLVNAVWLIRLRWVAVAGQFITIGFAWLVLSVPLQLMPLCVIVAFTALTNLVLSGWLTGHLGRQPIEKSRRLIHVFVAVMTLDLLSLTALLYFTGGPTNPFAIFYFVNLALAAVILPSRWGWTLTVIAIACLAGLFLVHQPLLNVDSSISGIPVTLRQMGLFVALVTCAVVVVYFITRVTRELRQRERELRIAEQQRAKSRRLEAIGTLAAGAGHELATPLSTIAVVTKELTLHLEGVDAPSSVLEDVALIRAEVDRCRTILDRMSGNLGRNKDERWVDVSLREILDEVLGALAERHRVDVSTDDNVMSKVTNMPFLSTTQAIRGVVQNALDASPKDQQADFSAAFEDGFVVLTVSDRGPGMSDDILARAGEPFFTTKEPGKGMGLGLFLTRSVIERLGGSLELQSPKGQGAIATIRIPASHLEENS